MGFDEYNQADLELRKSRAVAPIATSAAIATTLSVEFVPPMTKSLTPAELMEMAMSARSSLSTVEAQSGMEGETSRPPNAMQFS